MSLELLLRDLSIKPGSEDVSVISVLSEIRERVEERNSDKVRILRRTAEVFRISSLSWLFPEFSSDLLSIYTALVLSCTKHAALPLCETDSGTLPASSYVQIPGRAAAVGGTLLALSARLGEAGKCGVPGAQALIHTLSPALCVFSITHLQKQPWTDHSSRKCAVDLLHCTVTASGSASVHELLCGSDGGATKGILSSILHSLQPDITK